MSDSLIIEGATLIDGNGGSPRKNVVIRVSDGRISGVDQTPSSGAGRDRGQVIDARGKTVIPGLWDAHVHYHDWMAELYIRYGVTSILDTGNYADWILAQRDGIAKGKIPGPRIFACGNALGNHEVFRGGGTALMLDGPEDTRRKTQRLIEQGVDAIKVWAFADDAETRAACDVAHLAGRKAVAHLVSSAREAVLAGIDCLAHATGLPMAAVKDSELAKWMVERERDRILAIADLRRGSTTAWALFAMMDEDTFDGLIDFFLEHETRIEPDFIYRWVFASRSREKYEEEDLHLLEQPSLRYAPEYPRLRIPEAWYGLRRLGPEQRDELARGYEKFCIFFNRFAERGGKILAGSDSSSWPMVGVNLHRELELMVEAGLSPMEALVAATRNPAEFLGRAKDMGTVEPGKIADMLVINGDPLADIRATQRIELVIKDGRIMERELHPDYMNPIPRPALGMVHSFPVASVASVQPNGATEGDPDLAIIVEGVGFVSESVVAFDGVTIPTKCVSPTRLEATIPGYLFGRPGTFAVYVINPRPLRITDWFHQDERSNPAYFLVKFA